MKLFNRRKLKRAIAGLEGHTLGRYRVLEPLGRGGMARIYRAYHPQLDRYVAVKVLRADLVQDDAFFTRFRREAQAVAALRHPNIVQVFDYDVEDDVSYMVLELLEGDSLKTRLHDYRIRGDRMPVGEVVRVLCDVLDGLAYAHSEGMVHRDIKPGNILLTKEGQAIIADFGIAHIVGAPRHTVPGALLGTMDYMAPEQGLEGQSDARSDIYALGVVLYEMLTQRTPFEADTPLAVLMKHAHHPLPLPRQIDPSIPEPFERIVLKALAKDPDDRYQSAEAMARALREAARRADIELPQRISLPLSFATREVPSQSVAVFSGVDRERITEDSFADDDTQAPLTEGSTAEREDESLLSQLPWPIVSAAGVPLLVNLLALLFVAVSGGDELLSLAWPMELLLVAGALSLVMGFVEAIWMLAPVGILAGNGLIFFYCTLTGNWRQWIFLWVLELWLIAGVVWLTTWLRRHHRRPRQFSRALGSVLGPALFVLSVVVFGISLVVVAASMFTG
ncbi:MAG: serine/threonine-protein kinase [Anaerolineae bacterium]